MQCVLCLANTYLVASFHKPAGGYAETVKECLPERGVGEAMHSIYAESTEPVFPLKAAAFGGIVQTILG